MSWSKSDADAYLAGTKTLDDLSSGIDDSQLDTSNDQPAAEEAASTVSTKPTVDEPQTTSTEGNTASSVTDDNLEKVETGNKNKTKKSKTYTKEQKTQHAFAKEKSRRKAVEAEVASLKEKLKKYEGLSLEHFKNDQEAYNDYKLDRRFDEEKVKSLESEQAKLFNEEAAETARRRVEACFPDESNQAKYQNLIARAESNFESMHPGIGARSFSEFLLSEKDHAVISYLQDSDNAPKLIRHFIHKPEVAQRIMAMNNQYNKFIELKQLENRMLMFEKINKSKVVHPKVEKKVLPNTGKIAMTTTVNSGERDWTKPISKSEAERLLRNK